MATTPESGQTASTPERHAKLVTIRRRADFLNVRGGLRSSGPAFAIEARAREQATTPMVTPAIYRFGFTVTKRLGGAVQRNRIRRRLKEAVRLSAHGLARPGFDYVLIAREPALTRSLADLQNDVRSALMRLHGTSGAHAIQTSLRQAGSPLRRRGRNGAGLARRSGR